MCAAPPCPGAGTRLPPSVSDGGRDLTPWGAAPNVHFSKILIRPFIFRKS
jgi:hypothetical protein